MTCVLYYIPTPTHCRSKTVGPVLLSGFLGRQPAGDVTFVCHKPNTVGCRCFLLSPRLPSQLPRVTTLGRYQVSILNRGTYVCTTCLWSLHDSPTIEPSTSRLQVQLATYRATTQCMIITLAAFSRKRDVTVHLSGCPSVPSAYSP